MSRSLHAKRCGLMAVVVVCSTLTSAGCVVGPMEHDGRPPRPGEDLVTDLARATHSVAGVVRGVQHEESIPPPKPMPPTTAVPLPAVPLPVVQDMVVEEPVAVAALPAVEVPCFEVPFAEPVALPPPRFFPVPTRPVFSGSNCEPWRVAF